MTEEPRPISELRRHRRLVASVAAAVLVAAVGVIVWATADGPNPQLQPIDEQPLPTAATSAPTSAIAGSTSTIATVTTLIANTSADGVDATIIATTTQLPSAVTTGGGPQPTNVSVPAIEIPVVTQPDEPSPTAPPAYGGDGAGAPLPIDVTIAAPTLEPNVFATIPGGSVSVSDNGIYALDNGVMHAYDFDGVEVGATVLQDTFPSYADLYAGPDGCFYVDHYRPPNDGSAAPSRVVTVFDATGAKVDEGFIASDLGGEQEPFLAFGVDGIVDRIAGTTVVPYCDRVVRGPEPSERYPEDLPGATADTFSLGDEQWVVPINRDPNAAVLYSGEPWPELGPHGGLVATRWIGPSLTGPPTDYGTPSGLVLIRMRHGGAVDWFRIADDWRLVGSTPSSTLMRRGNAAGGTDLGWVFGPGG